MKDRNIVVLMGGPSSEAEVSRRTGGAILKALLEKGYKASGLELDPPNLIAQLREKNCELVFNAVHGKFGEDGALQGMLDMIGMPYTGSGLLASAVTMDKVVSKRIFEAVGISTPHSRSYRREDLSRDLAAEIAAEFSVPVVIKAASQGSSIGVVIVERQQDIRPALESAFAYSADVLVEEFIRGRELTVAVWGTVPREAFPVIEIVPHSGRYDYESKYTKGAADHIVPAQLAESVSAAVQELAVKTFDAVGCSGVARVDIMLGQDNTPYVLEVNSVPGMTETSLVPDAARAMGIEFPELCERILQMVHI
ncbi:MAG: D-alanine--D-alanine ligase family protein [Selenomonadaceae bacterium]